MTAVLTTTFLFVLVVELVGDPHVETEFPFYNTLHPYVMFRPPAECTWRPEEPSASSRYRRCPVAYTNNHGFRIASPTAGPVLPKPPGTIRVAVLGGSTVHGGTEYLDSLPGALQWAIDQRFPDLHVEVISAGIVSAISRQELIYLITTVVDYDIDVLVVYDGVNDSGQMLYYEHRMNYPYNFSVMENAWKQYVESQRGSLWRYLLSHSVVMSRLFPDAFGYAYHANSLDARRLIEEPDLIEKYTAAYIDNWEKIRRICLGYEITPFFILQPTGLYSVDDAGNANGLSNVNLRANYLVYESFRQAVTEFAARNPGIGVADYADLLPSNEYFHDGCHVFDEINGLIAREIVTLLGPAILAEIAGQDTQGIDREP